jgi:hypothetical protein
MKEFRVGDRVRHRHADQFTTPSMKQDLKHDGEILEMYRGEFGEACRVKFNNREWRLYTTALVLVDRAVVKAPLGLT